MSWRLLDGGHSSLPPRGLRQSALLWLGRQGMRRHKHITAPGSVRIHPEARIHPRGGEIVLGERAAVAPGAVVQGNVRLGEDCSVQAYAVLVGYGTRADPSGQIWIGDGVRIAPHVMLIAANHRFAPGAPIHTQGVEPAPITIEDDVWLAGRVSVMAGVRIGHGSVIGAGAVVTSDIPPNSLAVGVPARVIRSR
ncbi:DapH/DapD/GlmU-related protein [Ruania rhizosphaerae]|uniref:DapH/DapD/GlmU-related protein n=1 Tax=Ruania rhizosphaerae TaxID=1840413 RepID=UPI00135B38FD